MANRTRDYVRYQRRSHIARKKRIIKNHNNYWNYSHDGILSKGKIHCSCWMCRRKSYLEATKSDLRKAVMDIDELRENNVGEALVEHIYRRTKGENRRSIKGISRYRY